MMTYTHNNERSYYGPRGNYLGFNTGDFQPRGGVTMLNGRLTRFNTTPSGFSAFDTEGQPEVQAPPEEDILAQRYAAPGTEQAAGRILGSQQFVPLEKDPIVRDATWQRMYQTNPERAVAVFQRARGYSIDEAQQAGVMGVRTPQDFQLAARRMAVAKQAQARTEGFEKSYGFNPGMLNQPLNKGENVNQGFFTGYDPQAHGVWLPQHNSMGQQQSRFQYVDDNTAQAVQGDLASVYGARSGVAQSRVASTTQMQQPMNRAQMDESIMRDPAAMARAEYEDLRRRRAGQAMQTAPSLPNPDYGSMY